MFCKTCKHFVVPQWPTNGHGCCYLSAWREKQEPPQPRLWKGTFGPHHGFGCVHHSPRSEVAGVYEEGHAAWQKGAGV